MRFLVIAVALVASACASFDPVPLEQLAFRDRLQTEEQDGLRVSVAVLSREVARQAFGVNLQKRGIQPVWIEIENRTDKNFWFMMTGLDPNYFSAHEAAYMNHFRFGGQTNKEMDAYFSELDLERDINAGAMRMGFAFANETIGTKEVRVRLYSNKDVRTFEFFVSIPGVVSEWDQKDLKVIADHVEIDTDDDQELREALLTLPCCTQRENGTGEGDPLNIVLIRGIPALKAFIATGWDEAIFQKDFRALFGATYLYGRPPDIQFQKSRRRVDSINLVQLWITPIRYQGDVVLVGSVSRNIDPNVDEAVQYVAEDLATAGMVENFGMVGGVGAVSRDEPRQNFANAPYWTAGGRTVLRISTDPVELTDIDFFDWQWERRVRRAGDEGIEP
ncbi:MAG: hypothetical protein HKN81_10920 [Gammaproteobacteria bacterium]|nr:hypothetical protein [Gammaproteobacteria bacterium]